MSISRLARLRTLLWTVHRWIGIGLGLLLVPIAASGALLLFKDTLDAQLHPARYAVSGVEVAQPVSGYLAAAQLALAPGARPLAVRFPEHVGAPVTVLARTPAPAEGGPARLLTVYLDPPTARALDVVDFRSSLFGLLHQFHENLTIPEYSGRQIGGWVAVGMLTLSLTGIWLWWPRNAALFSGLRWRRTPATTTNLHHLFGFWISLPLAAVSATGIYLAFPQTARSVMTAVAPMNPPTRGQLGAQPAREAKLTPDAALAAVLAAQPGTQPAAIFLPTVSTATGERGGAARRNQAQRGEDTAATTSANAVWRVQLREQSGERITVTVDDRSGAVHPLPDQLAGDRAAQWIRWIHEGGELGPVWRTVVLLTGIFPTIFAMTGLLMWLRGRRQRRAMARLGGQASVQATLQAAE